MPIDYQVFQPRPLQAFDVASAFTDLAKSKQGWQKLKDDRQHDADANSQFAATFAADRSKLEYDAALKRYKEQEAAIAAARVAAQGYDLAAADAAVPSIQDLGGTARREETGNPNKPNYYFEPGRAPTRGAMDIQGARSDIFGGPKVGQPFQMPSPSGPDGEAYRLRGNPMDPPSMPGLSAAAAGPLPGAGPPQEAQPEQLGGPPMDAPTDAPQAPATGGQPQELTGPNPMNPPMFSPYRINMAEVTQRNQAQNKPLQQAFEEAAPVEFQGRAQAFNRNVSELGMSPERQQALTNPLLTQLVDMYQTGLGTDLRAAGQAATRDRQKDVAAQRKSDTFYKRKNTAFRSGLALLTQTGIRDLNKHQENELELESLMKAALTNGQAAYRLIAKNHDMADSGILTKDDYKLSRSGEVGWLQEAIDTVWTKVTHGRGLSPDQVDDIIAVSKIAAQRLREQTAGAMNKIYSVYKSSNDEAERAGLAQAIQGSFNAEYIPEELTDLNQAPEQPDVYEQPPAPPPASDSVGTSGLPRTLDGSPKFTPGGVLLGPGRIGPKPPRKKPISQEVDDLLR